MNKPKALCLLTTILGNKATARYLRAALEQIPDLETRFEFLTLEDYQRYPAPFWARLTNPWHSQYLFEQKFGTLLRGDFDLIFTNAWEFAIPLRSIAKRIPSIILMDGVPCTVNQQLLRRGAGGVRRTVAHLLHHYAFARSIPSFSYFFPMGTGCRDALVNTYGVSEKSCLVTLAPQNTDQWKSIERHSLYNPVRLLFVASNFHLKGGTFLLDLYSRFLADTCQLLIVSNDPAVGATVLPKGASWLKGKSKEDLLDIYRDSDLFIYPTQQDCMPQVVAEALTAGLPVVAPSVGDIPDLVCNGETGILMPDNSSVEQWADSIRKLIDQPSELLALRKSARAFAEQNLGLERFEQGVRAAVKRLLGADADD